MSLSKQFGTNLDKETQGIIVSFPEAVNEDGTIPSFRVARMGPRNVKMSKAYTKYAKPFAARIAANKLSPSKVHEISVRVFVECALLAWYNVTEDSVFPEYKGFPVPFTFDNAVTLFMALPDLFSELQSKALALDTFKDNDEDVESDDEGDSKN